MAKRIIIYDDMNTDNSIEITPNYEDKIGSPGIELILDLKGQKKFIKLYLSRDDAKELIKEIIEIIAKSLYPLT